jgi:hypothetical protein
VAEERALARAYLDSDGREIHWTSSASRLGGGAGDRAAAGRPRPRERIADEPPGTARGNWEWRVTSDQLTDEVGERLRDVTQLYDRAPGATGAD